MSKKQLNRTAHLSILSFNRLKTNEFICVILLIKYDIKNTKWDLI